MCGMQSKILVCQYSSYRKTYKKKIMYISKNKKYSVLRAIIN